jgi:hypothetical protein
MFNSCIDNGSLSPDRLDRMLARLKEGQLHS